MANKKVNVVSLFDGISCARVALEKAGFKVVNYYASEIDKYALEIAKKNYPDTIQLGDVVKLRNSYRMLSKLKGVDLLIGGSPCQDLSIAKQNRKGLDGSRSGLFYEYVRILKNIKPKYFILENVASMPKSAREVITKELGVEPIMINASLVSAQNRKRLFWTNIPNVVLPKDKGIMLQDILESGSTEDMKSLVITATYHKKNERDFLKKRSGQMVQIGDIGGKAQSQRVYDPKGKSVALQAGGGGMGAKTGLYAVPVALRNRGSGKKPEYNKTGKANAMTTVQTDSMVEVEKVIRKLSPVECERLQCLPDNYTEGISNSQRYKVLGNAFNVDVVAHILSFMK